MALTKVRGGGVDNPLTLGGGSASDRSIIFDGNAQDFHIGLDDSADKLTIGLGSTLGTTSHMVIDATGAITKPLQPAFCVTKSSDQNNFAVASEVTVTFDTERFDQNSDFSSNTFTAPVTGKYQLIANINLSSIDSASAYYYVNILTSNVTYRSILRPDFGQDLDYFPMSVSAVADMDANDTAIIQVAQAGGTQQTDIQGGNYSRFSGCLLT